MRAKITDIARLANVSTGTVDRVIHNRGEVSEKTRVRVEKILRDLNYQPDILARTLASKRAWTFSVLMPVSANGNDFWSAPLKGIEKALSEVGPFGVNIRFYLFNQFERESFAAKAFDLLSDNPDAVLFAPVFAEDSLKFINECARKNIHLTLFNSYIENAREIPYIGQDSYQSGTVAARLLSYGMNQPGDILIINLASHMHHNHIINREKGFRNFFISEPGKYITLHTIDSNHASDETINNKLNEAFATLDVKGIFVTNSRVYKVAEFVEKIQMAQIKLIGFDLLPVNIEYLQKGVIDFLISQRPEEQTYKGIMRIFNELIINKPTDRHTFMPVDIITKENIENYQYR